MPWFISIDPSIQMLRPISNYSGNYFQLAKLTICSILDLLAVERPNDPICLLTNFGSNLNKYTNPTADVNYLKQVVATFANPGIFDISDSSIEKWFFDACELQRTLFESSHHSRLIIITDGGTSDYTTVDYEKCNEHKNFELSCVIISLSSKQINSRMHCLQQYFKHTVVLCANSLLSEKDSFVESFSQLPCRLANALLAQQFCESKHPVHIASGHLFSLVSLRPLPCFFPNRQNVSELQLFLEIFGFLKATDVSHPPVKSRHTLVSINHSKDSQNKVTDNFLNMLVIALNSTQSVAMVNVYLQYPLENPNVLAIHEPHNLITHGFIHCFNTKDNCLLLSLFHEDCDGLPWLGKFSLLAPVADFSGSIVYNDDDNLSPFPVREAYLLSYKSPIPSTGSDNSEFQYVNWVHSQSGPMNDVNKIIRLSKRLPEKANIFFKELSRIKFTALAYGWPNLLIKLRELLLDNLHESPSQMEQVSKILSIEN